jgi:hypothetical protein
VSCAVGSQARAADATAVPASAQEAICPAAPSLPAPPIERYAVIFGSNVGGGSDQEKLRFADDDAIAAYDLATELGYHAVLLTDLDDDTRARVKDRYNFARPPTTGEFRAALAETMTAARAARAAPAQAGRIEVRMLVWISAHGGADGSLFFKDGRYSRLALAADLFAASDREGIDVDFVLDSCWPRAVVGRGPDRGALERAHARARWQADLDRFPRVGVLLAQTADGKALEWSELASGIFSFLVRSALRGAADADGDGRVTYTEVEAFSQRASGAISDPTARLKVRAFLPRDSLDRAVADWSAQPTPKVSVRLLATQAVRLRISGQQTGILLETNKGLDTNQCAGVTLRLPAGVGPFDVALLDTQGKVQARYQLPARSDKSLGTADFTIDERPLGGRGEDSREGALRAGLFRDPYDERSYRDWLNLRRSVWDQVDTTALIDAAEAGARRRTWGWGLVGSGAVVAIGGVLAYAVADATYRDWTNAVNRGDAADASALGTRTHRFDVLATVGFGLAGALGATGVGILLWDRFADSNDPGRDGMAMGLTVGPGGAVWTGRF